MTALRATTVEAGVGGYLNGQCHVCDVWLVQRPGSDREAARESFAAHHPEDRLPHLPGVPAGWLRP